MLQAQVGERGGGGLDAAARVAPGSAVAVMAHVWLVAQVTTQESNWNNAIDTCCPMIFKCSNAVEWKFRVLFEI